MTDSSSSTYQLVVTASDINGTNGWHSFNCYIEETLPNGDVVKGISETFGSPPSAITERFTGDIEKWRDQVASAMLKRHIERSAMQVQVLAWRGKKYAIPAIPQTAPSSTPPPPASIPLHDK
jgi:hypothetical protein